MNLNERRSQKSAGIFSSFFCLYYYKTCCLTRENSTPDTFLPNFHVRLCNLSVGVVFLALRQQYFNPCFISVNFSPPKNDHILRIQIKLIHSQLQLVCDQFTYMTKIGKWINAR